MATKEVPDIHLHNYTTKHLHILCIKLLFIGYNIIFMRIYLVISRINCNFAADKRIKIQR